jgi:hypothetical protein
MGSAFLYQLLGFVGVQSVQLLQSKSLVSFNFCRIFPASAARIFEAAVEQKR